MRETAAEFRKPILLYLIGKDSSVNVDTTWKFRDMIAFRDQRAKATPRKSSDQAKDRRALYYRAARHVLERHNSGARPTRASGYVPISAQWDSYFVARPSARPARPCSTTDSVHPFKPEQATSPLALIYIGSLSWI